MRTRLGILTSAAMLLTLPGLALAYEGYSNPSGGSGGSVVYVTNLNDSGSGSLRAAVAALTGSATIIRFNVAGEIINSSEIKITKNNVTIDGSSAPDEGITLRNDWSSSKGMGIDTGGNVVINHIRCRNAPLENFIIWDGSQIVIDHCSATWSGDGAIDINNGVSYVIISRCLIGGAVEGSRAHGANVAWHHGMFAYNNRRQPKIAGAAGPFDFRNNVVAEWCNTATHVQASNDVNVIKNHFGPPFETESWTAACYFDTMAGSELYTSGNHHAADVPGENARGSYDANNVGGAGSPFSQPSVTTHDGSAVLANVQGDVGAQPTDEIDEEYIDLTFEERNRPSGWDPGSPPGGGGGGGGGGGSWSETAHYYVDGNTGSDSNAGTSAAPFATITKAISVAGAGKKVLVWGNNTYTANHNFSTAGTSGSRITFKRDPASPPAVIQATGNGGAVNSTKGYITVDGFTITGSNYGVYVNGDSADGWEVKNCRITGNTLYGVYYRATDNSSIFNCAIWDNGNTANVYIYSSAINNVVDQCTLYGNKRGVYTSSSASVSVSDSIVVGATLYGMHNAGAGITTTYSDVWDNGTNYNGCSAGTGSISSDPKLADPDDGDFTLLSGSPCDNAASDGGDMGVRE